MHLIQKLWPEIVDLQTAKEASRPGVLAAGFLALMLTMLGAILGSPGALISGAIFAVAAWGIRQQNKAASVIALLIYLIEVAGAITESGLNPVRTIISIVFILIFVNSCRGTFAYHEMNLHQQSMTNSLTNDKDD